MSGETTHGAAGSADEGHERHGAHGGAGDHDGQGHDEDGHEGMGLGPVDLRIWGTGIVAILLGLAMAAVFAISTGHLG